jgi:hypothetical protein
VVVLLLLLLLLLLSLLLRYCWSCRRTLRSCRAGRWSKAVPARLAQRGAEDVGRSRFRWAGGPEYGYAG